MKIIVLMAAFVAWLGSNSDLPTPEYAPTIKYISDERAWHMIRPGTTLPADPDDGRVLAVHMVGTIYLTPQIDLDTPFGQSVLLHELVHFYQEEAGLELPCMGKREEQAYRIQKLWLEQQGVDIWDHLDPLFTMFVWQQGCGGDRWPEGAR
jgi:hypothetical protein